VKERKPDLKQKKNAATVIAKKKRPVLAQGFIGRTPFAFLLGQTVKIFEKPKADTWA